MKKSKQKKLIKLGYSLNWSKKSYWLELCKHKKMSPCFETVDALMEWGENNYEELVKKGDDLK